MKIFYLYNVSNPLQYVQLLDAFYIDMVRFILIMMSLPGPPTHAGIFDNPG